MKAADSDETLYNVVLIYGLNLNEEKVHIGTMLKVLVMCRLEDVLAHCTIAHGVSQSKRRHRRAIIFKATCGSRTGVP